MIGTLAKSKAGHDKGRVYIIIKEEAEYVYLADGKQKPIENPKKKSKKHIQPIKKYDTEAIRETLLKSERLRNEEVRRVIKQVEERNVESRCD